jgi:potassium-dependent mechanosensitive channel
LDRVLEILFKVAEGCPYRLKNKEISTRVYSFDDSCISVGVICWIKNSRDKFAASSWINLEIWRAFKREGVEIPFPQVDLHLKKN